MMSFYLRVRGGNIVQVPKKQKHQYKNTKSTS